jgi:hypothetical protein
MPVPSNAIHVIHQTEKINSNTITITMVHLPWHHTQIQSVFIPASLTKPLVTLSKSEMALIHSTVSLSRDASSEGNYLTWVLQ